MRDIDLALSQITSIRAQLAASTRFFGIAPSSNVLSGALALLLAIWQSRQATIEPMAYVQTWAGFLLVIAIIAAFRTNARARRVHGDMAFAMLAAALQRVLPFAVGGVVISCIVYKFGGENVWMLPGLWQMLIGLLGFSLIAILPRGIVWPALWYFVCGALVMALAMQSQSFSPWMMGIPFAVGQVVVAVVLSWADGGHGLAK